MALFDKEHKAEMEKNGQQLRARLEKTVSAGLQGDGLFDKLSLSFSQRLLHDMNTRKVRK